MSADQAIKAPCRVATAANIALSGLQTIDGVALAAGDRVLVRVQTNAVDNGIYESASGTWSRAGDFDGAGEVVGGTTAVVTSGVRYAGITWRVDGSGAILAGTNPIIFEPELLQDGAGATPSRLDAAVRELGIVPAEFGIAYDGTDESDKLQAMIDAAAAAKRPILLHGGEIVIGKAIDLRGRCVDIRGAGPNATVIKAGTAMDLMLNVEDEFTPPSSAAIVWPFSLQNLRIEGDNVARVGISIKNRHFSDMTNVYVIRCVDIGVKEKDTWNNYRNRVFVQECTVGVDLVGSNNSSVWTKCGIIGSNEALLKIGNQGTAGDGNVGLLFQGCDFENARGKGIIVASGCDVTFTGCYVGEDIDGVVLENRGEVSFFGGAYFFGRMMNSFGIRPLGGRAWWHGTMINGQTYGSLMRFSYLSDAEVDAGGYGRWGWRDVRAAIVVEDQVTFNGDVLDHGPSGITFAPRLGRSYAATNHNAASTKTVGSTGIDRNWATFSCTANGGPTPLFGCVAALTSTDWMEGVPMHFGMVYESDTDLIAAIVQSAFANPQFLSIAVPAAPRTKTFLKLNKAISATDANFLQIYNNTPSVGDSFTIQEIILADFRQTNPGAGILSNLYKC